MKWLKIGLLSALATLVSTAQAGMVDFKALANAMEKGYDATAGLQINAAGGIAAASGGTGVTFLTAKALEGSTWIHAYLDSGNAGLGACTVLTGGAQCNPASDDNVTTDTSTLISETLHFTFSESVNLGNIYLNNNHDGDRSLLGDSVLVNGTAQILSGGGSYLDSALNLASLGINPTAGFTIGHTGATCTGAGKGSQDCEFYVSKLEWTDVPAPAPLALLGLGLLGLGTIRRRVA